VSYDSDLRKPSRKVLYNCEAKEEEDGLVWRAVRLQLLHSILSRDVDQLLKMRASLDSCGDRLDRVPKENR